MLDITKQTPLLVFSNIFLLVCIYQAMKGAKYPPYSVSRSSRIVTVMIFMIFCLFSFWGADWFGYIDAYNIIVNIGAEHSHLENVYIWIVENLTDSYFEFRFIVWGLALFLLLVMARSLPMSYDLFLLLFGIMWLPVFSYARVSLALAMMYCGTAFLFLSRSKIQLLFGIALIVASVFFHKSAVFGVIAIFLTLLSLRFSRLFKLNYIVVLFPVFVLLVQTGLVDFMSMDYADAGSEFDNYARYGQSYLAEDARLKGIGSIIQQTLNRIPFYLLSLVVYKAFRDHTIQKVPVSIKAFMYILFYIVFIASIFAFNFSFDTSLIYSRLIKFSAIPAAIVLVYCYQQGLYPKLTKMSYSTAIIATIYSLTYVMYNTIVG